MKRILVDMDGVIADFYTGVHKVHGMVFNEKDWKTPGDYNLCKNTKITEETIWQGVDQCFWSNLPCTKDADKIILIIKCFFSLENIGIFTHYPVEHGYDLSMVDQCMKGKMKWLEINFPELTKNFFLGTPKSFLAGPDICLLDDFDHNINSFKQNGGQGILLPRIWNSNHQLNTLDYLRQELKLYTKGHI